MSDKRPGLVARCAATGTRDPDKQGSANAARVMLIAVLRPALGERFLAIGRVQNAGKLLAVCTGEVRAFSGADGAHKVVALMQATIVNVRR